MTTHIAARRTQGHRFKAEISTVYLGLDHNFEIDGPPLIYETMVFGGTLSGEQKRYPNRHAALAGHDQLAAEVRDLESLDLPPQARHGTS